MAKVVPDRYFISNTEFASGVSTSQYLFEKGMLC